MNTLTNLIGLCKKVTIDGDEDRMEVVVRGPNVKVFQEHCDTNDIICELERVGLFYYATLRLSEVM